MNDALKQLYNRFYTPLPMVEAEQEIKACHKQFIEQLEKSERKLVLRIMDALSLIAKRSPWIVSSVGQIGMGIGIRTESFRNEQASISSGRSGDGCLILST